jgi:peptidoglycan/LPS O-acetylase OafA/YrhL
MSVSGRDQAERLHGLDALRAGALLLGVVLHASLSFFPQQIWIVADDSRSIGAAWLFFAIHLFRMTAFFLIAGLFAHMMLARRGWVGFAKDRAMRIAGPLAAFWFPVMAGIVTALVWNAHANGLVTPGAPPPPPPTYDWTNFPLTHLWFLWVLTLFYAAVLILRAVVAAVDRKGRSGPVADTITGALIGPWTPVVLAATGLCLRFLSGRSPVRRYLSDASYWVYIVHLPLIMLAQVWVQDWAGPWGLKLAGVSLGVFAVCLISYELLIRHSSMGRWLNGRRMPWRNKPTPALVPAE